MMRTYVLTAGLATFALLDGGAAQAGVGASVDAGGSLSLLQADTVNARQSVVTGAMGVPITVDIVRGVALAALPTIRTPLAAPAVASSITRPLIVPRAEAGTIQQASFVISGDRDLAVSIAIPSSVPLARLGGGDDVEFATASSLGTANIGQSRLASSPAGSGELAFDVGGHVEMKQNVLAGAYAGVLRVTVQYN